MGYGAIWCQVNYFFLKSLVFIGSSLLVRVVTVRNGKIVRYEQEKPPLSPSTIDQNIVK